MPKVFCQICQIEKNVKPSHLKLGYGKYCSIRCRSEGQKKGTLQSCHVCGKETWKSPKDFKRSKSGFFFCSKACQTVWRNSFFSGEKHANWLFGEKSYRERLLKSDRKKACTRCGIEDIRVLSAHHKDKDRHNNSLENLEWLCLNCHFLAHCDKK